MPLDVLEDAEVDQRQALRIAPLELVQRPVPGFEVDVGRRRGREHELARFDANAGRVARIERAVAIEVADVVVRVAGARNRRKAEGLVADDVDVLARDGGELAPEPVEVVAVEPSRAALEPARVDEVRRADLGDVHLQPGMLADEHARGACMVEVDVREQQVAHVGELEAALGEPGLQLGYAGRRSAVLQRRPVVGVEQVRADHPLVAEVAQVERLGHQLHPCQRSGSSQALTRGWSRLRNGRPV